MLKNNKFIIVAAGDFHETKLDINKDDFLCACDAGLNYLKSLNLKPNIVIGDFDSLGYIPSEFNYIKLNTKKDDTDVMDAIKYGIKKGYKTFYIYGALGKRMSHSLANIEALLYLKELGFNGYLSDKNAKIQVLHNESLRLRNNKQYVSLFSLSESSCLSLKGFIYNLDNYELKNSFPLGIDNEIKNKIGIIKVFKGDVLLIEEAK